MMTRPFCAALALLASAAHGAEAPAPQLEAGAGAIVLRVPDYRGSDRDDVQAYPIPYLAYRSERLQVTREGVRAWLFAVDRLSLSFSGVVNLPGSDDNPDRAGMPALDPTFEGGPSLDLLLAGSADGATHWRARWPVRAAIAADGLHLKGIGWVTAPHLRVDRRTRHGEWDHLAIASLGAVWSSEDYHEYFYGVAPAFAQALRPTYDAASGYGGLRFNVSGTLHHGRWRVGAFASYDYMAGAAFADSPLFKTDHSLVTGVYVTYRLHARGQGVGLEGDTP